MLSTEMGQIYDRSVKLLGFERTWSTIKLGNGL